MAYSAKAEGRHVSNVPAFPSKVQNLNIIIIMETKKYPSHDIHRMRPVFFLTGVIVSLGITISAFQWETKRTVHQDRVPVDWQNETAMIDVIAVVEPERPKPDIVPEKKIVSTSPPVVSTSIIEMSSTESPEAKGPDMTDTGNLTLTPSFTEPEEDLGDEPFLIVETPPQPVGGYKLFYEKISKEIRYPRADRSMGMEGKVFLSYIVERDGTIGELKVEKGISKGLNEEAMRVIRDSKWTPGKQRGKPVRVRMVLPIYFKLG